MKKLALVLVLALAAVAQAEGKPSKSATKAHMEASGKTELTWWGHAAFVLKTPGGAVIAIDPWLKNPKAPPGAAPPAKLDAILVTHGHFDHVGETVELAKQTGAPVVGCFELVSQLGVEKAMGGNVGGTVRIKDVTIHMVEAVHSSGYSAPGSKTVAYGGAPLGFVIAVDNGPTLYHAGDTAVFKDMGLIGDQFQPTVALLPIGGVFTMDPSAAARAVQMLKTDKVIPMHFGTFPQLTGTPAELSAALKKAGSSASVVELKPGQTMSL